MYLKNVHNQKRLCHTGIGVFRRAVWLCHSRPTTFFGCAAWLCRFRSNLVVYTTSAHNLTDRPFILAIMRRKPVRTTSAHNQRTTSAQPARTTRRTTSVHNLLYTTSAGWPAKHLFKGKIQYIIVLLLFSICGWQ